MHTTANPPASARINHPAAAAAAAALALGIGTAPSVTAQEGPGLEEIVVTARKIEENLRDIPLTVSAFSEQALEERGIASLQDIADATPGFDFAQAFGRNDFRPVIRGQSNILGRANAGLFVDGIIVEEGNASVPLSALQRVEVVKGPQSALYGRSTLAGAINYVLKEAGDAVDVEAQASLGERGHSQVDLHASGPLSDTVGLAVTFSRYERGGEYDNHFAGNGIGAPTVRNEVGDEQSTSLTGVATFTPIDRLNVRLHGIYESTDDGQYAIGILPSTLNNCFQAPRDGSGLTQPTPPAGTPEASAASVTSVAYGGTGYYCGQIDVPTVLENSGGGESTSLETEFFPISGTRRDSLRLGLRLDYDFGDNLTFTSITGFNSVDTEQGQDQTFGQSETISFGGPLFRVGFLTMDEEEFKDISQEFRVSGGQGSNIRYMLGAYYYDSDASALQVTSSDGGCSFRNPSACAPSYTGVPLTDNGADAIASRSVFGSLQVDVSERVTLGAELRYNEDEFDIRPEGASQWVAGSYDAVLPKLTLSYRYSDDTLIYGNIGLGNKPGTLNASAGVPDADRAVDEETALSYEVGVKSLWMEGRAESNIAVFHTDWEDMQVTSTRAATVEGQARTFSILENIGEAGITGLEADLSMRLTDNWDVRIAYAWTDSEIEKFVQSVDAGASAPGTFREAALIAGYSSSGDVVISGTQLPHSSRHQASVGASFHGDLNTGWNWFARADFNYNSKRYAQVYNLAHTGSREILNLRAGLANDRYSIDLWVDNALDNDASPALIRYVHPRSFIYFARAIGATMPEKRRGGITARFRF